jgi:5-methylcytosine-specific restriction protein A
MRTITNITKSSIQSAIKEYDDLGQESFLSKYGYKKSKDYELVYNEKEYDSKAIVGVAFKYEYPTENPLTFNEFSGGLITVVKLLRKLDFDIHYITIVKASIEALKILKIPSSIEEIRKVIDDEELYIFGAEEKNIDSVIRNNIERCSENTNRTHTQKIKYFNRIKPNTYALLEWTEYNMNKNNTIKESFENFKSSWFSEKEIISNIITSNKIENSKLKGTVSDKEYNELKKTIHFTDYNIYSLLCKDLPSLLLNKSFLPKSKYLISGSIGQGQIAEVPWICIYDKEITQKAETGYYLVYLVKSDLSGFYLSLNQGWTQYKNEYGTKDGKLKIKENALKAKKLLKSINDFSFNDIDLLSTRDLGKGYQLANICSKYYSFDSLPNDEILIDDLRSLIGVYKELKGYVGLNILDIENELSEDEYQENIQEGKIVNLQTGPIKKKEKGKGSSTDRWPRDKNIAYTSLDNANFECEFNSDHKTFISNKTKKQFVEAHHLIPMQYQDEFDVSLDVPENIISLCPICHRAFHNAQQDDKTKLIKHFFNLRKDSLDKRELSISENEIIVMYK